MAEACRALDAPVISGNVSLYNETEGSSILPTPTVAMVGLIEDAASVVGPARSGCFRAPGERVVLFGEDGEEHGGSAYLRLLYGVEQGRSPAVDLARERALSDLLCDAWREGLLTSCHDLSTGGLAVALAEATFGHGVGARIDTPSSAAGLFSETQGRALATARKENVERLLGLAARHGVLARDAGETQAGTLDVAFDGGRLVAAVEPLHQAWREGLPRALAGERVAGAA